MKYRPGLMVGPLSGSVGSTTASHNWAGHYFRSRVIPVNPSTPSQTAARVSFTNFAQMWRDLTDSQRQGWEVLSALDPITDRLGASVVLTGIAYYCRFNMTRRSVALARLDDAPVGVQVPPTVESAVLAISGGARTINYTPTVIGGSASNHQIIMATAPTGPGVNFFGRSDFRIIDELAGEDPVVPPADLAGAYEAVFGIAWRDQVTYNIAFRFTGVQNVGFIGDYLQAISPILA